MDRTIQRIIPYDRSIVVAADVSSPAAAAFLAGALKGVNRIGGFKVGLELGLAGLKQTVDAIRNVDPNAAVIYDHQKAGNDIPEMGAKFAKQVKMAGCDAAILFPFAGPETQERWTKDCQDAGLGIIVGGVMTHPKFLVSEGGYIADDAPERIVRLACALGVRDFVVPGTKIAWVEKLHGILVEELGIANFVLYAPGFITQGGDISECGRAAGAYFHPIVGRDIYGKATAAEMREAAVRLVRALSA